MYTDCGEGGHYHYDTEPETIKYTGYFSVAKQLIKIDQTQKNNLKDESSQAEDEMEYMLHIFVLSVQCKIYYVFMLYNQYLVHETLGKLNAT